VALSGGGPCSRAKNPPPERGYRYRPHCGSRAVQFCKKLQLSVDIDVHLFTVTAIAGKLMQLLADDKSTMEIRNRYQTLLGII
jgi:hypothetical protein